MFNPQLNNKKLSNEEKNDKQYNIYNEYNKIALLLDSFKNPNIKHLNFNIKPLRS